MISFTGSPSQNSSLIKGRDQSPTSEWPSRIHKSDDDAVCGFAKLLEEVNQYG